MWRLLFLILVVVGALAALLGIILTVGVAKVALVQSDLPGDATPTTSASALPPSPTAGGPGSVPPASGISQPTAPATTEPARVDAGQPAAVPQKMEGRPAAEAMPAAPIAAGPKGIAGAQAVALPEAFVPGTIVLRGADAKLHGKLLRKSLPEGDLTHWIRQEDFATWVFNPAGGRYRVVVTRANAPNSGGDFAFSMSESKKADFLFLSKAVSTGGWETFRRELVGVLDLDDRKTTLALRPAGDLTSALMRLRQIELIPVEVPNPGKPDDNAFPEVTGLTIVEASTGKPLTTLTNAMVLNIGTLPPISIRAETAGKVGSVRFSTNKVDHPFESERPFSIAGERGAGYIPWTPSPGKYAIVVAPFSDAVGAGKAGKRQVYYVTVISSAPVVLAAKDATLHGDAIGIAGGDVPSITNWSRPQDWVEWNASIPNAGDYAVELYYSLDRQHGGSAVVRAGDAKVARDVAPTGGWEAYERLSFGTMQLSRGKTRIAIKPGELREGRMLMNLREVRLVPVVEDED